MLEQQSSLRRLAGPRRGVSGLEQHSQLERDMTLARDDREIGSASRKKAAELSKDVREVTATYRSTPSNTMKAPRRGAAACMVLPAFVEEALRRTKAVPPPKAILRRGARGGGL